MKKIIYGLVLFLSFFSIVGCGNPKVVDGNGKKIIERPVDKKGLRVDIRSLKFYIPTDFIQRNTNNESGKYEFYTGEYVEFGPTGIDLVIDFQSMPNGFEFEKFALEKSTGAISKAEMKKEEIHEHEWYVGEKNGDYFFYSYSNDGVMDIHFHNNGTNNQNGYLEAVKMFKNTLYVEQRDTK